MKTTITEEYDGAGHLVKRTTVTDGEYATGGYIHPLPDRYQPALGCTCSQPWNSLLPPPPCPVHGQAIMPTITVNVSSDTTPEQMAADVAWALRATS